MSDTRTSSRTAVPQPRTARSFKYRLYRFLFAAIGVLPAFLRYRISDVLYFIAYRLLGYRTSVVRDNLSHAFPEKSTAERKTIERRFYLNLCDMLIETLALSHARHTDVAKRWIIDYEGIDRAAATAEKGLILLVSHQLNWEEGSWILAPNLKSRQVVVYTSLSDSDFGQVFLEVRQRNGQIFVNEKEMIRLFRAMNAEQCVVVLAADQSPFSLAKSQWHPFFHRQTPFHQGIEQVARRSGYDVAFMEILHPQRGMYETRVHPWPHKLRDRPEGELTADYVRFIEAAIRRHPENYLWTHRRWKHSHRRQEFAG